MIDDSYNRKYNGTYRLSDKLAVMSKRELLHHTHLLGLHVPQKKGKSCIATCLEKQILSEPRTWLSRLTNYELQLLWKLASADDNGSVHDKATMFPLTILDAGLIDFTEWDDDEIHYIMPNELRWAVFTDLERITSNSRFKEYAKVQQFAMGLCVLYGVLPLNVFLTKIFGFTDRLTCNPDDKQLFLNLFLNSAFFIEGQKTYIGFNGGLQHVFTQLEKGYNDIARLTDCIPNIGYKEFTDEEIMNAGQIPWPELPCKEFYGMLEYFAPYYKDKSSFTSSLLFIWRIHQDTDNKIVKFIQELFPVKFPASKLAEGTEMIIKYMDAIPRWKQKGHSWKEILYLFCSDKADPSL